MCRRRNIEYEVRRNDGEWTCNEKSEIELSVRS